jgi:hypothetical protein
VQQKFDTYTLQTGTHPDYQAVVSFKKSVAALLKKGWELDGDLIIAKDGNLKQHLRKRK